jgi:pimeloyl-ACP methyl ester carboxylesterase
MAAKHTAQTTKREIALLLPGMTFNASVFPDLDLATVAADFNELALGPEGGAAIKGRMDVYRRRLDELLGGTEPWAAGRRLVIAHSFGGMLALHWLLAHGGRGVARIDGLVLVGTTAGPMFDVVRLRLGRLAGRERRLAVKHLMPIWNMPVVTRAVKLATSGGLLEARRVDFRSLAERSDLALDLAGWRNTDWRAMRSYRIAMHGFDVRDRLGEVTVPTIVLHGTEDALFPISVARDLARLLPAAELRLIDGAAHGLPLTHGAEVQRAVRDLSAT